MLMHAPGALFGRKPNHLDELKGAAALRALPLAAPAIACTETRTRICPQATHEYGRNQKGNRRRY